MKLWLLVLVAILLPPALIVTEAVERPTGGSVLAWGMATTILIVAMIGKEKR